MKRLLWFCLALAPLATLAPLSSARAQTVKQAPDVATARREIQAATDQLVAALKRGDAAGALGWMAPDFRLGERQYRARDLEWMQRALPLQLQRGRYRALSIKVTDVELRDGIASTEERVNADIETQKGVETASGLQKWGTQGYGQSRWVQSARGWRLSHANSTLEALLYLAAPPAPLQAQSAPNPDGTAAAVGLPLQEPVAVIERINGQFERALAFSPDGTELVFNDDYRANHLIFADARSGETKRIVPAEAFFATLPPNQNGSLWTAGNGQVRRLNRADGAIISQWNAQPDNAPWTLSVAPDGGSFAVSVHGKTQIWDAQTGQKTEPLQSEFGNFIETEFSPDGSKIALISYQGVEMRDAQSGALLYSLPDDNWGGFLSDGKTLATQKIGFDFSLRKIEEKDRYPLYFRDLGTGEIERTVAIPAPWSAQQQTLSDLMEAQGTVRLMGFTTLPKPVIAPDGNLAASVYFDGSIGVWNTQTGTIERILRGFDPSIMGDQPDLLFAPDGQQLAVNSGRGEIAIWDLSAPVNPE